MDYQRTVSVKLSYPKTTERVRQALADQGFGVLSEIDVQATLRDKRGLEMENYLILGACNPDLAHRALMVDRTVGVLLPCTVVIRVDGECCVVSMLEPQIMASLTGRDDLRAIADEASRRLHAAFDAIAAPAGC